MAGLRKELMNEGLGLIKDIGAPKPKVKVELPDISELEEKLEELYPQRIAKRTQSQKEPPVKEKLTSTIARLPSQPELPTREETTAELKRRLVKELVKAESDLSGGLKIAGKPCDCLEVKHTLLLEAAAEELIAFEPGNPIYQGIITWIKENQNKVTIPAIVSGQYAQEYPKMASQFKDFRKRVMGTAPFYEKGQAAVIPTEPDLTPATINLLAKTEGNPTRKFCCRQCDECAPPELLEEGRFPDRISWLRKHYAEKHPRLWGKAQKE